MTIGERIKFFRKLRNISANKLSILIGKDPSTLSKIESNAAQPSLETLTDICNTLDISLSDFFSDPLNVDVHTKSKNNSVLPDHFREFFINNSDLTPDQLSAISNLVKQLKYSN